MNREQKAIVKCFIPPLIYIFFLWLVKFVEIILHTSFGSWGVLPRHFAGLPGIFTYSFIHADIRHLASNSISLLILGAGLVYFYKELALKVFLLIFFLSGFWLWLGGREYYHIGASGIVYGLITFLFFSGILRKHTGLMALSLLVVFLYGGLVWGIFPLFHKISWEGHLFGSLAGILCAFVYRAEGPQRKLYEWEKEDEPEENNFMNESPGNISENEPKEISINYIYKKDKNDAGNGRNEPEKN